MSDEDLIIGTKKTDEDLSVDLAQAMTMLPEGDTVHTFIDNTIMIEEEEMPRQKVLELLERGNPQHSGGLARGMGHGLVAFNEEGIPVFIETAPPKPPEPPIEEEEK